MVTLYPPIIDNTISAFVADQSCEIAFYFQGTDANTEYVVARIVDSFGDSILRTEYCLLETELNDLGLINVADQRERYSVTIEPWRTKTAVFPRNTQLNVTLYALSNDATEIEDIDLWMLDSSNDSYHSIGSQSVIKYAIASPSLKLYCVNNGFEEELKYGELNQNVLMAPKIRFNGYLTFDLKEAERETDSIAYYYLTIDGNSSNTILYPEIDSFGNRYISFTVEDQTVDSQNSIQITYVTNKGYIDQVVYRYEIKEETVNTDSNLIINSVTASMDKAKGNVLLTVNTTNSEDKSKSGTFAIYRTENNSDEELLLEIDTVIDTGTKDFLLYDVTVEGGKIYKYKVIFYHEAYDSSENITKVKYAENKKNTTDSICAMFENIKLVTKEMTMTVSFNPDISSYKRNVIDVVSQTLGGKYPYVRRNGSQKYRTFDIKGTISIEALKPENDYTYEQIMDSRNGQQEATSYGLNSSLLYTEGSVNFNVRSQKFDDTIKTYYKLFNEDKISKVEYDIICERLYREKILDFLYSPDVKLFKSLEEGNIFVYLTNIQFTPNKTLSRRIYDFSCQAVEVTEASAENYRKYFSFKEDQEAYVWRDLYLYSYNGFNEDGNLTVRALENNNDISEGFGLIDNGEGYTLILVKKDTDVIS